MKLPIEVKDISKSYGNLRALKNVSFSVQEGEVIGLLGPNGAGKSTTMRILVGLASASEGEAWIYGHSVALEKQLIRRYIGYMPENNPLPDSMKVVEYLRYRGVLKGLSTDMLNRRVDEVMDICDLNRKARNVIIYRLSKGYRQRVGIADAILANPKIIILDEPTIGLDPHQVIGIRQLIDRLRQKMTIILSSHILPEVELVCNRFIIMNTGSVVAQGTMDGLRSQFIDKKRYTLIIKKPIEYIRDICQKAWVNLDWSIKPYGDSSKVDITFKINEDIDHSIHALLRSNPDWDVQEMYEYKPNLEDIFIAATARTWDIAQGL